MLDKEFEAVFAEIVLKNGKKVIADSLYRAPESCPETFLHNFEEIVNKVLNVQHKELIIGTDHNMNFLIVQGINQWKKILDIILGHNLLPFITRPTRITQQRATLIDNIIVSEHLHKRFDYFILITDISDHLPTVALLEQTKILDREPLQCESRNLTIEKINIIKLLHINWT